MGQIITIHNAHRQVTLNTARGHVHPTIQIRLSKTSDKGQLGLLANNTQQYLHTLIENLGADTDVTQFRNLTADLAAGRHIEILPDHRICTYESTTGNRTYAKTNDHYYQPKNLELFRNNKLRNVGRLIPILDQMFGKTPTSPAAPVKSRYEHLQTSPVPLPSIKTYLPTDGALKKASTNCLQFSQRVFQAFDNLSIGIDRKTHRYLGVVSLAARASLLAIGTILAATAIIGGHLSYVPLNAGIRKLSEKYDVFDFARPYFENGQKISLGTISVYCNGANLVIPNQEIEFDNWQNPNDKQKQLIREYYQTFLQYIINEVSLQHPIEAIRQGVIASIALEHVPRIVKYPTNPAQPTVLDGIGLQFPSAADNPNLPNKIILWVPNMTEFSVRPDPARGKTYQEVLEGMRKQIDDSFNEPAETPPNDLYQHMLTSALPIELPANPGPHESSWKHSITKCTQTALSVLKKCDEKAVEFNGSYGKYLGVGALAVRGLIDLTGVFGLAVTFAGGFSLALYRTASGYKIT